MNTKRTLLPVIKWSGSKRHLAENILKYFPERIETYYEPFVGGGSVLGKILHTYPYRAERYVAGDLCAPLIDLWNAIQTNPSMLLEWYRRHWTMLQEHGQEIYYEARERFNQSYRPEDFLFLSRTCMNGLIRFNRNGEFNSSFHLNRPGINPANFHPILCTWSSLVSDVQFMCADYMETTKEATAKDLIYFDPPYHGTRGMYSGTFETTRFFTYLRNLNARGVRWILSYDGTRGEKDMTAGVPDDLYARHVYIDSGCSSFSRIKERGIVNVKESLYINW